MRQVVLDTETTGLETSAGHRIIEIGCVELVDRKLTGNTYHQYINPERLVDEGAMEVHGISNEFLDDKPVFADIFDDFIHFVTHKREVQIMQSSKAIAEILNGIRNLVYLVVQVPDKNLSPFGDQQTFATRHSIDDFSNRENRSP